MVKNKKKEGEEEKEEPREEESDLEETAEQPAFSQISVPSSPELHFSAPVLKQTQEAPPESLEDVAALSPKKPEKEDKEKHLTYEKAYAEKDYRHITHEARAHNRDFVVSQSSRAEVSLTPRNLALPTIRESNFTINPDLVEMRESAGSGKQDEYVAKTSSRSGAGGGDLPFQQKSRDYKEKQV